MTSALDDLAVARRFVERLATLPDEFRRPVLPPLLDVDPYLSAWSNVEAALGERAPAGTAGSPEAGGRTRTPDRRDRSRAAGP